MPDTFERPRWGPILVGTDGSEAANRAVDYAGALTAELRTKLWIIHVTHGTAANVAEFARSEEASIGDAAEAIVNRLQSEAAQRASAAGAKEIHMMTREGDCAEEIIGAAHEVGATAIFVGRRGAGGRLARALMGSVSQKLAGISPLLLVIVP